LNSEEDMDQNECEHDGPEHTDHGGKAWRSLA
jgi:hypothetical protein